MLRKEQQKDFKKIDFISFLKKLDDDDINDIVENLELVPCNMYTIEQPFGLDFLSGLDLDVIENLNVIYMANKMLDIYTNDSSDIMFVSLIKGGSNLLFDKLNEMDSRLDKIDYLRFLIDRKINYYLEYRGALNDYFLNHKFDEMIENVNLYFKEIDKILNKGHPQPIKKYTIGKTSNFVVSSMDDLSKLFLNGKSDHSRIDNKVDAINISYSFNSFYDAPYLDDIYRDGGVDKFKDEARRITNDGVDVELGIGYKVYALTEALKNAFGKSSLPLFNFMITKHPPYHSSFVSFLNHKNNISFDKLMYLGGADRSYYNYVYGATNPICRSKESFEKNLVYGLSPILAESIPVDKFSNISDGLKIIDGIDLLMEIIKDKNSLKTLELLRGFVLEKGFENFELNFEFKNNKPLKKEVVAREHSKYLNIVYDIDVLLKDGSPTAMYFEMQHMLEMNKLVDDIDVVITVIGDDDNDSVLKLKSQFLVNTCSYDDFPKYCDIYHTNSGSRASEKIALNIPSIVVKTSECSPTSSGIVFIFDVDEVLVSGEEKHYQNYHLNKFNKEQEDNVDIDFGNTPLQTYFLKLNDLLKRVRGIYPAEINLLTARGGNASSMRVMRFLEKNKVIVDKALFLDGGNKTDHILNMSNPSMMVKFIDDHPLHIDRVVNLDKNERLNIIACHYPVGASLLLSNDKKKKPNKKAS